MKDEFFDWLNDCPVQWVLNRDDSDSIEYIFYKQKDEDEDYYKCEECGNCDFEYKDYSNKTIKICGQCKSESYEED